MTLGEKIRQFDETDQTVKDFNELFETKLTAKETTRVMIGEVVGPDNVRLVQVGTRTRRITL